MQKFLAFTAIGLELGALMFVALLVGRELDERFQTNGLIFVGLALIFLIAWFTQIIWMLKRLQTPKTPSKSDSRDSSSSSSR